MRLSELLPSRRVRFEVGVGMLRVPLFGLGMRDSLGMDTDILIPRVRRPPELGDAMPPDVPAPSQADRGAWSAWWLDTLVADHQGAEGMNPWSRWPD